MRACCLAVQNLLPSKVKNPGQQIQICCLANPDALPSKFRRAALTKQMCCESRINAVLRGMRGAFLTLFLFFLAGCADTPSVSVQFQDEYRIARMSTLRLQAATVEQDGRWWLRVGEERDSLLAVGRDLYFVSAREGVYQVRYETGEFQADFTVVVVREAIEYSPYIAAVVDYCPAPGQFVNLLPQYEEGDGTEDMRRKAERAIAGGANELVSLGGFGGYLTFRFDHTVVNVPGVADFAIYGNAFDAGSGGGGMSGASAEPGIVQVAFDYNGNGRPDEDEWYELAGSEHDSPETRAQYSIVYYRPNADKPRDEAPGYIDRTHIAWRSDAGDAGYLAQLISHEQPYYPQWLPVDSLRFTGTLLPSNGVDVYGTGNYYVLEPYEWGYADNRPNSDAQGTSFDIAWAVDKEGRGVSLPGVDFVRVYTGVNQQCGWLGETSTEISGARDLHIGVAVQPAQ